MEQKKEINNVKSKEQNNLKDNSYNKDTLKKIEERKNRFSGLTSYELLKVVKMNSGFPKKFSKNIPLETLVNFYHRYWNINISLLEMILDDVNSPSNDLNRIFHEVILIFLLNLLIVFLDDRFRFC